MFESVPGPEPGPAPTPEQTQPEPDPEKGEPFRDPTELAVPE